MNFVIFQSFILTEIETPKLNFHSVKSRNWIKTGLMSHLLLLLNVFNPTEVHEKLFFNIKIWHYCKDNFSLIFIFII